MSAIELGIRKHSAARAHNPNPFVPISDSARLLIVLYFAIWRMLPSVSAIAVQGDSGLGYPLIIVLVRLGTDLLLLLPFLRTRFGGTEIGWLHPLILPTVISIAFGILRDPSGLLEPLAMWLVPAEMPSHTLLVGWSDTGILVAQLKLDIMNYLALMCTYVGILSFKRRPVVIKRPVRLNGSLFAILIIICFIIVFAFLQQMGGILSHMATLGGGRFRMREQSGQYLVINAALPYLLILWYAYKASAIRNVIFLGAFATASILQFIVIGSRSGVFTPVAMLLSVWIFHNQRIPAGRAVLLGVIAVLLLGALGEVRRSGQEGAVDFTALTSLSLKSAMELSADELETRKRDTGLAIAALVPEHHSYLWGSTYIAAFTFWLPRSFWPGKPRGAGAHASALLFGGLTTMDEFAGGGYPVAGAPEAYWNFGFVGIVVVFVVYGRLIGSLAEGFIRDPENPLRLTLLLIATFALSTPNTTSIVTTLQLFVIVIVTYLAASRLKFKR